MSQQIKSSRAALFCKTQQFSQEIVCDEAQKGHYHWCFLVNRFCEYNFFSLFHSFHVRTCSSYNIGLLKNFGKLKENFCARVFFLDKVAHDQACNFLKRNRCFTVNFEKLFKALCRTPTVSASNFNSTFLTLKMDIFNRKMDIYVFHFMCLMEATSKSIWFYITLKFESGKLFLTY